MSTRKVDAGEMHGFRVVNIFPKACTEEEWTAFADAMSKILSHTKAENHALAQS